MLRLKVRKKALREVGKAFAVGFMAVAVLWLTSGYPVISQQVQMPTRGQIVKGLDQVLSGLSVTITASTGDILDVDNAVFYSDPDILSLALIPLHPASPSLEKIAELVEGKDPDLVVPFAALYLEGEWPGLPELAPGTYILKLKADRSIVAVKEGKSTEVLCGCWWRITEEMPLRSDRVFSNVSFEYASAPVPTASVASSMVAQPWWYFLMRGAAYLIASVGFLIGNLHQKGKDGGSSGGAGCH